MIRTSRAAAVAFLCAAAACSKSDQPAADPALNNDLSLAQQAQAARADTISAIEQSRAQAAAAARQPVRVSSQSSAPVARRRTTSSSTTSSSSSGSVATGSNGGYTPAPAPTTTVEKHGQRDAAIGAGVGAIIGATTSKNKVKGGLIGAAAGGILGAVVGNNVDKKKTTTPP